MNVDETFNKLKIELVIRDFSQMLDVNYKDTFVFTIRSDTFKLFLVIVKFKNLKYH